MIVHITDDIKVDVGTPVFGNEYDMHIRDLLGKITKLLSGKNRLPGTDKKVMAMVQNIKGLVIEKQKHL